MKATRGLWLMAFYAALASSACGGRAADHGGVSSAGTTAVGGDTSSGSSAAGGCSTCDGGQCVNGKCCNDPNTIVHLEGTPCAAAGDYCGPGGCGDACWCQDGASPDAGPSWMCGPTLCIE